jgi:anti-sigma factor RsiW
LKIMSRNQNEHPEWIDRLSDYVSGELSPEAHADVEGHLSECGGCRRTLEELQAVIAAAAELGELEPPRDLWGGIAATIGAPRPSVGSEDKVIAFPARSPGLDGLEESGSRRAVDGWRIAFSMPQLLAASVALVAISSLATWAAAPAQRGAPVAEALPATPETVLMAETAAPPPALAQELEVLERALAETRTVLDPNTVRVLERNLAVIELAIDESRQALAQDPENEFLAEHLERVYERKLAFLQEATRVAEWSS